MERRALQQGLYQVDGAGSPALHGQRCRGCGRTSFPPHPYGCEACGAEAGALERCALRGEGTLASFATVHLHQGDGIEAPFTIGVILLDDGPAVRATLGPRTDAGLAIGTRVRSVLAPAGRAEDGAELVELRFEPQAGAAAPALQDASAAAPVLQDAGATAPRDATEHP